MDSEVRYYLPLFKGRGDYLRITRNSAFVIKCPAKLKRKLDECSSLLLVGNTSLTKFVIVGFSNKPCLHIVDIFKVLSLVDERIKFMLRMRMNTHLIHGTSICEESKIALIDKYLIGTSSSLFS